jgi:hypothetical protein
MEFNNAGLLMLRYALPNNEKVRASNRVLLPDPFLPMMRVLLFEFKLYSVKVFPDDRKFL